MKLTEHFKLGEFTRSYTAKAHNIDNSVPDIETAYKLVALCVHILEPLREHVGHPIRISSGYRCPALNAMLHGAANSQHMKGEACDIVCGKMEEAEEIFDFVRRNLCYDQLILESKDNVAWVHVSYVNPNDNRYDIIKIADGNTVMHLKKVNLRKNQL